MGKGVAVEGEVTATPGTTLFTGADSGTWTAPPSISYKSYTKLTISGRRVVYQAKGTFTFSGLSSSGATITGPETVTLTASTTLLQKGLSNVLVDGDSATGIYGNELKVQSNGSLKTG